MAWSCVVGNCLVGSAKVRRGVAGSDLASHGAVGSGRARFGEPVSGVVRCDGLSLGAAGSAPVRRAAARWVMAWNTFFWCG